MALATTACALLCATRADAQSEPLLELDVQRARRYGIPAGFDPLAASVASSATDVAWMGTTGIDRASSCVVILVTQQGAQALTYRHQDNATACSGVDVGEAGEVFLRGFDPTIMNNAVPSGFTVMLDASGALRWAIEDTTLVNATSRADGGTGEFIGAYGGISRLLAYSPEQRALMAFSVGSLMLGLRATPVTQAHLVDASTGSVRRSGQGFGTNGVAIVGAVRLDPGVDDYLLYTRASAGEGGSFFRYNGRSTINALKPFDRDWSERVLVGFDTLASRSVAALLWSDGASTRERITLSMMTTSGEPLYETELAGTLIDASGNSIEPGRPVALHLGTRYTLIQYLIGTQRYMRVLDSGSGELLGGFYMGGVEGTSPLLRAMRVGAEGNLHLIGWDRASASLEEYTWRVRDTMTSGDMGAMAPDMSADMGIGQGDMFVMVEEGDISGSEFCQVASPCLPARAPWAVIIICVVGLGLRRRREA